MKDGLYRIRYLRLLPTLAESLVYQRNQKKGATCSIFLGVGASHTSQHISAQHSTRHSTARNVFTAHKYLIRLGPADVKVDQKKTFVPVPVSFPKKMCGKPVFVGHEDSFAINVVVVVTVLLIDEQEPFGYGYADSATSE